VTYLLDLYREKEVGGIIRKMFEEELEKVEEYYRNFSIERRRSRGLEVLTELNKVREKERLFLPLGKWFEVVEVGNVDCGERKVVFDCSGFLKGFYDMGNKKIIYIDRSDFIKDYVIDRSQIRGERVFRFIQ